jgi:hypothetical protein
MRRTSARRELAFVLAVASAGLALVLVVVFAPWYTPDTGPTAELPGVNQPITRLIDSAEGGAALTP